MTEFYPPVFSWHPSPPDYRDFSPRHAVVRSKLRGLKRCKSLPRQVDLRSYFPAVRELQSLNAATAQACVCLVEYFQRRALGQYTPGSVRFVYKLMRTLLSRPGDSGGDIRTALKAIVRFGIPPAELYPESIERFDEEPEPYLYCYAEQFRSVVYLRLDQRNMRGPQTLKTIKAFLAAGFPCVLGFSVPESLSAEADIPWRPLRDRVRGGQAAVVVGFDDRRVRLTKGALLIRSSWGPEWGEEGYGWLPYHYVKQQVAVDCWTVLKSRWLASNEFRRPLLDPS